MSEKPKGKIPSSIKALLDVIEKIPPEMYEDENDKGTARVTRRLVHIILAKHANPDGTSIHCGQAKLAALCGVSDRQLRRALDWLLAHGLIAKLPTKHTIYGTNQYSLLWPAQEVIDAAVKKSKRAVIVQRELQRLRVASWRRRQAQDRAEVFGEVAVADTNDNGHARLDVTEEDVVASVRQSATETQEWVTDSSCPVADTETRCNVHEGEQSNWAEPFQQDEVASAAAAGTVNENRPDEPSNLEPVHIDMSELHRPTSTPKQPADPNGEGDVVAGESQHTRTCSGKGGEALPFMSQPAQRRHAANSTSTPGALVPSPQRSPKLVSTLPGPESPLTVDEFMAVLQKIWRDSGDAGKIAGFTLPFKSSSAHRERAFALASQYGQSLFLLAWEHCLRSKAGRDLMYTPKQHQNPGPATRQFGPGYEPRAWPLQYFVDSGLAILHMSLVKPFLAFGVRGEALVFLSTLQEYEVREGRSLTPEQINSFLKVIQKHGPAILSNFYVMSAASNVQEFLRNPDNIIQQCLEDEYVDDADEFLNFGEEKLALVRGALLSLRQLLGSNAALCALGDWVGAKPKSPEEVVAFCEQKIREHDALKISNERNTSLPESTPETEVRQDR